MIKMNIILNELKQGNCDSLYYYDQFMASKFFEYALNDNEYVSNLEKITGFENMKHFNPKHEHMIIVACKASLQKKNKNYYKIFYKTYLEFKSEFMNWRGRYDWFHFHKLLVSHLIWNNDIETLVWTWKNKLKYCNNFKKKFSSVSDWRANWYRNEIKNLKCYIVEICIFANKLDYIKLLVKNKVFKIGKYINKIFIKSGYICNNKGIVQKTDFHDSSEWKYICYIENDITKIDLSKCVHIYNISNCNQARFNELFDTKSPEEFWNFFINIEVDDFNFITSRYLTQLIKANRAKYSLFDKELQTKIIIKLFHLFENVKVCLIFEICEIIYSRRNTPNIETNYLDTITEFIYNFIINSKIKYMYYYDVLKTLCDIFIQKDTEIVINDNDNSLSDENIKILYHVFNNRISNFIKEKIRQIKRTDTTDDCPICLDNINSNEECILFCGHTYHKECITKDLKTYHKNNINIYKCPICRTNFDKDLINLFL